MSRVVDSDFQWTSGEDYLTTYVGKKGAGIGFCKQCGSTLVGIFNGKIAGITLGTLNNDPQAYISEHIFVGSKASWDEIGGDAPQYDEWAHL